MKYNWIEIWAMKSRLARKELYQQHTNKYSSTPESKQIHFGIDPEWLEKVRRDPATIVNLKLAISNMLDNKPLPDWLAQALVLPTPPTYPEEYLDDRV